MVGPRSIAFWDIRFGLGAEATYGKVIGFVDLIGDAQWTATAIAIDGQASEDGSGQLWRRGAAVRRNEAKERGTARGVVVRKFAEDFQQIVDAAEVSALEP